MAEDQALPEFMNKHGDLFDKHFPPDLDDESMILKAHLLVESLMRDFCTSSVPHPERLKEAKFQFHQVLSLARALCPRDGKFLDLCDVLWGVALNLNQLRNAMAHELEPDPQKIESRKKAIIDLVNKRRGRGQDIASLRGCLEFALGALGAFFQVVLYQKNPGQIVETNK